MNIREAKLEILNTLRAYHLKNEDGTYRFPVNRQRPILLMGPPGVGKTAILEQIAAESGVGLVSYTLTHHTRQSAVGLPRIEHRTYRGQEMSVTEYTMSEILASLYRYMEETGKTEGILFLDEVNCVSETLAPTMLQLLQNKTFGTHKVPDGWMIVTAGNPPEYNKSVREFDIATLDRVRLIPVEADCSVWMDYARQQGVHGAILSYLTLKPEHFYLVEDRAEGKYFVTARGWEDLSQLLQSYEALDIPVTKAVVQEYLQKEEIAGAFAAYYLLYRKYDADYDIPALLSGRASEETRQEKLRLARNGSFEERFTVVQLLLDGLETAFRAYETQLQRVTALHAALLQLRDHWGEGPGPLAAARKQALAVKSRSGLLEEGERLREQWVIEQLEACDLAVRQAHHRDASGFETVKALFRPEAETLDRLTDQAGEHLDRAFRFAEDAFGQGQELTLLVTNLTRSDAAMAYITANGSDAFLRHADALLFRQQERQLQEACKNLMG